jgi:hypothetical protein
MHGSTSDRSTTEFTKTAQYKRQGVIGLGAFMNSLENTIVQIERSGSTCRIA